MLLVYSEQFRCPAAAAPYRSTRRMLGRYMQAREVAHTLGIKTGTLAKWRHKGKGPKGWVRLGRTSVAYPVAEAERLRFGKVIEPRLDQLIRQPDPVSDRLFPIEFLDSGWRPSAFTPSDTRSLTRS